MQNYAVVVSDLHKMNFDPVSDRRNFTTTKDSTLFKQQLEENYAAEHDGFSEDIKIEMEKVLAADVLMFIFPM